jgi:hypothetical protein
VLRITLIALALTACRGRPSQQECEEAFLQLERIATSDKEKTAGELGRGYLESFKKDFMTRCTKDGTKSEVDCIKESRTLDDLDKCAGIKK